MTGPIRGARLPAEVKRFIVRAVTDAKAFGMPIARSCAILMIDPGGYGVGSQDVIRKH